MSTILIELNTSKLPKYIHLHIFARLKFLEPDRHALARYESCQPRCSALTVACSQEIGNEVDNTARQLANQLAGLAPT